VKKKNDPFFVKGKKQRDAREARLEKQRSYAKDRIASMALDGWTEVEGGLMRVEPGVDETKVHFLTVDEK
jgi:hypothetical protein